MTTENSSMATSKHTFADAGDVLVDIAMPVYRRTTYVAEAIESVLAQSFVRWRLRICENGAGGTDIERVVRPYLIDHRISYHATGAELSLPENWTRAINHGDAPFVALLHDDDRWHPEFLSARIEALQMHPECGFAFGELVQIDGDGHEVWRTPTRFREGLLSRDALARSLVQECTVGVPTAIVRRAAYEAVGAWFKDDWQYCDWEMWVRLATRYPAYYLTRNDSDLRLHAASYSLEVQEMPDRLVAMAAAFEAVFRTEIPGFDITRRQRARYRSLILMRAAESIHLGGGWKRSRTLYLRSLRSYPPTLFTTSSLRVISRTLLGPRASHAGASTLRRLRRPRLPVRRSVED